MRRTQITLREAARLIMERLLGSDGLGDSTFAEEYPDAYRELLEYRGDMESAVANVLAGKTIFED